MTSGKILILGGSSFIGRGLFRRLGPEKSVATYNASPFPGGVKFDARTDRLSNLGVKKGEFSHAIILLGITNIDACATDMTGSHELNVRGIKKVIEELYELDICPVFASSEMVFDGLKGQYVETDPVNPKVAYGEQKAAVEKFLAENSERFIVTRIGKVYGTSAEDVSILAEWRQAIDDGTEVVCAHDYISSAVHLDDLIDAMLSLILAGKAGIYHLGGTEPLSRLDMFEALLGEMNKVHPVVANMKSCSIDEVETIEGRPHDISMDCCKLISETGFSPRDIQTSCHEFVQAGCVKQ
jgi:dTDP-4-dehydrorhamnose reductase